MEPRTCESVTARVVALHSLIPMATPTTVGTSAAPNARKQMSAIASESVVVGSLVRNARTVAAIQPGTINSDGEDFPARKSDEPLCSRQCSAGRGVGERPIRYRDPNPSGPVRNSRFVTRLAIGIRDQRRHGA